MIPVYWTVLMFTLLSWGVYDTCVLDCLDVHPPQLGVQDTHVLNCIILSIAVPCSKKCGAVQHRHLVLHQR